MELEKKILQHAGSLYAVCYSKKLDLIFTGGVDNVVASWNPRTFENTDFSIKTKSTILNLTIANEKHLVIGLFNGDIHIIDLVARKEIKYITYHKKGVFAARYNAANNCLIVGSGDGKLSIWNCDNYELLLSKQISESKIRAIEIHDDSAFIGTTEGVMYTIDINNLQLVATQQVNEEGINSLCYLPQKDAILIGGKDAHLKVFSLVKKSAVLDIAAHNWAIYKLIIIDGSLYSCSRDKTIKQWDVDTLELSKRYSYPEFKAHTHSVNNMAYVSKHNFLISVGDDKAICYWKI
ncbi:MAG: WD40 repeat protein [Glaciecola sp.]|jgi:WD40 repeat protein